MVIVIDTLRADGVTPATMPTLTSFASESRDYRAAYATAPWTLPSHVSLFTGRDVHDHGCDHGALRYEGGSDVLASDLAGAGYRTAAFTNNPWITEATGLSTGFEVFVEVFRRSMAAGRAVNRFIDVERTGLADAGGARTVAAVGQWLDQVEGEKAFVFVNLIEAHLPYEPPPGARSATPAQVRATYDEWLLRAHAGTADDALVHRARALYDEELTYVDTQLRTLFDDLRAHDRWDDALVVVTSDHGEGFAEGHVGAVQLVDHQLSLRDELLHVPLLVRWPGRLPAATVDAPVSLGDVRPLVRWAVSGDGPAPALVDPPAERLLVASYGAPTEHLPFLRRFVPDEAEAVRLAARGLRAARRGRYKLVQATGEPPQLFDLAADPLEQRDVAAEQPVVAAELTAALPAWTAPGVAAPPAASEDALRAIGYLEGP